MKVFKLLPAILLLWLSACAAAPVASFSLPPDARPDLPQKWLSGDARYAWPPRDGFAESPVLVILPPGTLLDRFGGNSGRFLSPKGAGYKARALPYTCATLTYTVFQVLRPLPVWAGKAAPWFDEPGGATQFQTDAPVSLLLNDRTIEPMPYAPAPC